LVNGVLGYLKKKLFQINKQNYACRLLRGGQENRISKKVPKPPGGCHASPFRLYRSNALSVAD
jgi:hypothetical protein